jgi:molybdate transport system substrate-binding protein
MTGGRLRAQSVHPTGRIERVLAMRDSNRLRHEVWFSFLIFSSAVAVAAEVKVLSDGPLEPALVGIAETFRRASGHDVKFVFGLSPVIHKRITDGEAADVVIIQPDFIEELVKAGKVAAGEHPVIGRVGIGLFTRADAAAPADVSTSQGLKQALQSADTLIFNNVASGNYFATVLERLGIAEAVKTKVTRTTPPDVIARIVQGKGSDIGIYPVTLIVADRRLKLIGALPSELQSYIAYAAAMMSNAASTDAGQAFIRFLGSPASKAAFGAAGVN